MAAFDSTGVRTVARLTSGNQCSCSPSRTITGRGLHADMCGTKSHIPGGGKPNLRAIAFVPGITATLWLKQTC